MKKKEVVLLTGCAGFIGSNLLRYFLKNKIRVLGIDNFKLGSFKNIAKLKENKNFFFKKIDISDLSKLDNFLKSFVKIYRIKTVWHLAANSEIKNGFKDPDNDYKNTFLTTFNLIKIAQKHKFDNFIFASSSAIFGKLTNLKIKETSGPLLPISTYGAMKLASEGIISAAKESFLKKIFIFRFPNVVGSPSTHGVIHDFINKLKSNPLKLNVLGNGKQQKIYMHVDDLIHSMIYVFKNSKDPISLFNIGPNDKGVTVNFIAKEVTKYFKKNKKIIYQKKSIGWVGDVAKFSYSVNKFNKLGSQIKISSKDAIIRAIKELINK